MKTKRSTIAVTLGLLLCLAAPGFTDGIPIADLQREEAVDFEREILPVLRRKCLACHNSTDAESDFILETPQTIAKGGASGEAVVAGKATESLLLKVASHLDEPIMPPEGNDVGAEPLTSEELGLLKLWIDQGAKGEVSGVANLDWQPLPPGVNPVYAVAVSPDGQFAAAGRANQIFLYHLPSKRELGRLTDPRLIDSGVYDKPGVAHLDLVQSLRFSPDSQILASGGYRTVKLWRRERDLSKLAIELDSPPTCIAISQDGLRIAIGQEDGSIVTVSGATVRRFRGHKQAITGLEYYAEGGRFVSTSRDKTVRFWQSNDGSNFATLETAAEALSVAVLQESPQEIQRLAVAQADGKVQVWDLSQITGDGEAPAPVHELTGHSKAVTSLATIGGQPNQLLSGSHDGTVRVWDAVAGNQVRSMDHGGPVESVAARPDGSRFASASSNNTAKLWGADGKQLAELKGDFRLDIQVEDVERQLAVAKRRIDNAKADLKEVTDRKAAEEKNATSADEAKKKADEELKGKEEAAAKALAEKAAVEKKLADAKAVVTKSEQDQKNAVAAIAKSEEMIKAANEAIAAAQAAMQESQKQLASAEEMKKQNQELEQKTIEQIKVAQDGVKAVEEELKKVTPNVDKAVNERDAAKKSLESAVRTAERAQQAVTRVSDQIPIVEDSVKVTEAEAAETEKQLASAKEKVAASQQPIYSVAFSPDGIHFATGGADQHVRLWDAETGVPVERLAGHGGQITAIQFAQSGDVVSAAADKTLSIWNASPQWKLFQTIGGEADDQALADRVTALDFSPDGAQLATGSGEPSRNGQLKIWKVEDGSLVREIPDAHSDTILGLEFAPDGNRIASCGADRFAKIFEIATGNLERSFEGHTHHVLGVAWRADGRMLATSGADNVIKVWNVKTGDQVRTITGFGKEVTGVRFLAAGDDVVASSGDQTVQRKNATNGRNVRSFSGAQDFLYSVSTSANGKFVAAGGEDSVLRIWQEDGKVWATFE